MPVCSNYAKHYASIIYKCLILVPANERVHIHNERNFPQAKFDNEHGDLFLEHNNSVHIILFNFFKKIKNSIGLKKDMVESVQKDRTLECKL